MSRSERGYTLTELTVVMVLAALVTVGLVTFYLNSQAVWLDASTQSMEQRDATLLLEQITQRVRSAGSAVVVSDPDSLHQRLILFEGEVGTSPTACWFYWDSADSLIHLNEPGPEVPNPVVSSKVARFQLDRDATHVYVYRLQMAGTRGTPVEVHSSIRMYNSGS